MSKERWKARTDEKDADPALRILGLVIPSSFVIRISSLLSLAIANPAGDNRPVDVGNLIRSSEHPSEAKSMKRGFSSSRFDWLTTADCILRRFYFRHDEAEFPTASQSVCNLWTSRGSRAADCASSDALRPLNNWAIIEDHHELLSTGETPAPWARSASTKGRPRTFSGPARASSETKNTLATHRRIFWKRRRPKKTSDAIAQRSATTTAVPALARATAAVA